MLTQGCVYPVACPLVYDGHLSSTNLCPQISSHHMGRDSRPSQKPLASQGASSRPVLEASRTMGSGPRSQSLRGPRPTYGKLQEPWGKPRESRLRRALSLTQGHEKSRPSIEGPERLDTPGQEWLPGGPEDTERLIQAQQGKRQQWQKQYQQVWLRVGGRRSTAGERWGLHREGPRAAKAQK